MPFTISFLTIPSSVVGRDARRVAPRPLVCVLVLRCAVSFARRRRVCTFGWDGLKLHCCLIPRTVLFHALRAPSRHFAYYAMAPCSSYPVMSLPPPFFVSAFGACGDGARASPHVWCWDNRQ